MSIKGLFVWYKFFFLAYVRLTLLVVGYKHSQQCPFLLCISFTFTVLVVAIITTLQLLLDTL